ncbi:MAG: hypothetical protein ACOC1F_07235, partial [Myxococcota bacterium]
AHRMLTGKLPFEANTALELMLMHVGTPAPRLSSEVEELAPLDAPVLAMLEKEPDKRPASLSASFGSLLEAAERVGVEAESLRISISPEIREAVHAERAASRRSDRLTPGGMQTPARAGGAPAATVPGRGNSGRILVTAAAIVALAGVATFVITKQRPEPLATTVPASTSRAPAPPAVSTSPAAVASPPEASSEPAPPASVSWTFDTEPESADVFVGDKHLGKAPGPFLVKRSDKRHPVTIRAPGFRDEELELDATADRIVSVQLKRRPQQPAPRPDVPKDLEYPF